MFVVKFWIGSDRITVIACERTAFSHACFCSDGVAAIHKAAGGGHSSTLELLIANDADVNVQDG